MCYFKKSMIFLKTIFLFFISSFVYAEVDKTLYDGNQIQEKINQMDWKSSNEVSEIQLNNSPGTFDISTFPFAYALTDKNEISQYIFWGNGYEDYDTELFVIVYPSEDPDNNDSISLTIDEFNEVGYVEGSDWTELDPEEDLKDQWNYQKKRNKEIIANGGSPINKIEWHITPKYNSSKGYVFSSTKLYFENGNITYNTFLYILGRNGYQFINVIFSEDNSSYVTQEFINQIVDSFKYNPGMGYGDFQEGDNIAKTSAKDLISAPKEKELNIFIPEDYLCSNAISARKGSKLSDYAEVISLGMVSGYNTFDFMMETEFGYYETSEEFLNSLSDFCRQNQNERFSLAIIKIINLSE